MHHDNALLVEHLDTIGRLMAGDGPITDVIAAVDAAAGALIGHRLFTIMCVHPDAMEVERLYSNMPHAYPVAGRKNKGDTWWGRHVVDEGRPYIGHGPADLAEVFPDHETIAGLGLQCVLNMPIVYRGVCRGTMNLLDAGDVYSEGQIPVARVLASTLLPVLLCR